MAANNTKFRSVFKFTQNKHVLHWFPFHMQHAFKRLQTRMQNVDAVIEVHDARIPLTGRSSLLKSALGVKPHVLILNKFDLADVDPEVVAYHLKNTEPIKHVVFMSCKRNPESVKRLTSKLIEIVESNKRYNRAVSDNFVFMVVGVPNTGKSSLINALCGDGRRPAEVGSLPGVTRQVATHVKIRDSPATYVLDTPGIYEPRVRDVTSGLRLALCGALQDFKVGVEVLADYLLFTLNKHEVFHYVEHFGLDHPTDDIGELLDSICITQGLTITRRITRADRRTCLNVDLAGEKFLRAFRSGELGKLWLDRQNLDEDRLPTGESVLSFQP